MSVYTEALVHEITGQGAIWDYFVRECRVFRAKPRIVHAICAYCPLATIIALAEIPFLPTDNPTEFFAALFSQLRHWDQDALLKLTMLFGEGFTSERDFAAIAQPFVAMFDELPSSIRAWFGAEFSFVVCPVIAQIINDVSKSESIGVSGFCQKIKETWLTIKDPEKIILEVPHPQTLL
jgi:hypothetical protein